MQGTVIMTKKSLSHTEPNNMDIKGHMKEFGSNIIRDDTMRNYNSKSYTGILLKIEKINNSNYATQIAKFKEKADTNGERNEIFGGNLWYQYIVIAIQLQNSILIQMY